MAVHILSISENVSKVIAVLFNVYSVGTCVLTLSAEQACAHTQRAVSTEQVDSRFDKRTLYMHS